MKQRTCPWCGKKYTPMYDGQIFCSVECREPLDRPVEYLRRRITALLAEGVTVEKIAARFRTSPALICGYIGRRGGAYGAK